MCLVLGLFIAPASAEPSAKSHAPRTMVTAASPNEFVFQTAKVIFSTWGGEEIDESYPPVSWPQPMKVPSDSDLAFSIHTSEPPDAVELRIWQELKPKGIPRGKPRLIECRPLATSGCALIPKVDVPSPTVSWTADFDVAWSGQAYLAIAGYWPDAQVAWISHLLLRP